MCFLVMSLSSCCWPAVRGVAFTVISSKFVLFSSVCAHCTITGIHLGPREMILCGFSLRLSMHAPVDQEIFVIKIFRPSFPMKMKYGKYFVHVS